MTVADPELLEVSVTVTRVGHPLCGSRFAVWGWARRRGRLELLLVLADGSKTVVPAVWTDLDTGPGRHVGNARGRRPARAMDVGGVLTTVEDLLRLRGIVVALTARAGGREEQAARKSPAKEDTRAAH